MSIWNFKFTAWDWLCKLRNGENLKSSFSLYSIIFFNNTRLHISWCGPHEKSEIIRKWWCSVYFTETYAFACFSQHRCSSDRQSSSAHVRLLLILILSQRCLLHVHGADRSQQWPRCGLRDRQQLGQSHLSQCAGLL